MHTRRGQALSRAGMRGIASSSMTSLDGSAAASMREREAAAKARASLDFSLLAEGARAPAHQRARSAEIAAQAQHKQQVPAVAHTTCLMLPLVSSIHGVCQLLLSHSNTLLQLS